MLKGENGGKGAECGSGGAGEKNTQEEKEKEIGQSQEEKNRAAETTMVRRVVGGREGVIG